MNELILYFLKVNILLTVFTLVYYSFFKKESFFLLNRLFLLSGIFLALFIPFIIIPESINKTVYFPTNDFNIPNLLTDSIYSNQFKIYTEKQFLLVDFFKWIYLAGTLFFGFRFVLFLFRISDLIKKGKVFRKKNTFYIITTAQIQPFSFFNYIFLNKNILKNQNLETIINHENVHIKQGHSFDLILIELLSILFWFNPFIYGLQKAIKTNHEFLADASIIQNGTDKLQYIQILATPFTRQEFNHFGNHFKSTSLKTRIVMITRNKPGNWYQLKYFLIIPIIIILIYSFGFRENAPQIFTGNEIKELPQKTKIQDFLIPFENNTIKTISARYGMRVHPISKEKKFHFGIDFSAPNKTPVVAIDNGKVRSLTYKPKSYGKYLIIDHANGFSSLYAQLSDFAVKAGQTIKQGELIGFVGSSGMSTGPHLHLELKKDGEYVNPENYLNN